MDAGYLMMTLIRYIHSLRRLHETWPVYFLSDTLNRGPMDRRVRAGRVVTRARLEAIFARRCLSSIDGSLDSNH